MRRFWLIFKTEFAAWQHDPITALGGVIPSALILIAFSLLFGGKLLFPIGVANMDEGAYGDLLIEMMETVESPFGTPYYEVREGDEEELRAAYERFELEGIWIIPANFSARVEAGKSPELTMVFNNYNDDRAKNHRIYSAEILWAFYDRAGYPVPPLAVAETYPRSEMIHWFPIIGVGIVLMASTLGGLFNMYALTHKEQVSGLTLEFAGMPRSLLWVLVPKVLLALILSLATGTLFLLVLRLWIGIWPSALLLHTWLLLGLVSLFWIAFALMGGLRIKNYMGGALLVALSAIIVFFIGGGLSMVRVNRAKVTLIAWLFPNTYAVDPLRDMILFNEIPADWNRVLPIVAGMAFAASLIAFINAGRQMRRADV